MKFKFIFIAILSVLLLFTSFGAIAQDAEPESPAGVNANVGTTFTYQGYLSDDGSPANGNYNFQFDLYDALTIGNPVGSSISLSNVPVSEGIFTVELDFGDVYDGTALWLEIRVRRTAVPTYTVLSPRQPLNATPYALYALDVGYHTHLWQTWSSSSTTSYGLKIQNNATSGSYGGIYGETNSPTGSGVRGYSEASSGNAYGVYGSSPVSPTGRGIYGVGNGAGVYGETYNSSGYALYGEAMTTSGTNYGVYGESNSSYGYGGYFVNSGSNGTAIFATGSGAARDRATLRVENTESTGGVTAYLTNDSTYATGHFYNGGGGEVLYLQNGGEDGTGILGGDFITAVNESEGDVQFKVTSNGTVYSDGGYHCGNNVDSQAIWVTPATSGFVMALNPGAIEPCLNDNSPADFAEMFPTTGEPEPGDVLAIGSDGNLILSTEPYQTTIIGVRSTRPSFLGNAQFADEDGYAPLALLGVVPVKASAENGAIQPGDLLVSSSIPGHAMRAGDNPPQGTVIGKALETLEDGTGFIIMVVTLQ